MKRFVLTLSVLVSGLSVAVNAAELCTVAPVSEARVQQDDRSARKEARKQKRQQEMQDWLRDMEEFRGQQEKDTLAVFMDSLASRQAAVALDSAGFVLEADYVTFRRGTRVMVNSGTNFISLNADRAVVQISPSDFHSGPNGVGGITVQGRPSDVRVHTTKKGETVFTMNVSGIGINAMVEIRLMEGSDRAYATVSPNFSSNTVRLEGRLVPFRLSRTIEGMSL